MTQDVQVMPDGQIEKSIFLIRGHKVMLDITLAELYGVTTKRLNQQVSRNVKRFPPDFMFQLTETEYNFLRLQNATSRSSHGGRRYTPYVFTEQGIAMLSSVLTSERAIEVNLEIMRTFVRIRKLMVSNNILAKKLGLLEQKYTHHDHQFKVVFDAIRQLMEPPVTKKRKIGFV